jgi:uncharacterized protein
MPLSSSAEVAMDSQKERKKKEDAWFHDNEKKLLTKLRNEREARMKEKIQESDRKHREELKKAHWMCCPKCGQPMVEKDHKGVLVDVCTFCEGVFFDRGELEDLLDKEIEARRSFFFDLLGLS